ncbi:MAG: TIGR00725 family protein [Pseudomonadota bacterium]
MTELLLDRARGALWDREGRSFEPLARTWSSERAEPSGDAVGIAEAAIWLQRDSGQPCRVPVGVIGARQAPAEICQVAEDLGRALAELGATVICGGKGGVMEAACRGVALAEGLAIGLLPDGDWQAANAYVGVPIATGIGVARNAIIARASLCLVAVGGGYGTLSEMAYGLQFGRPVFRLPESPEVEGAVTLGSVQEAQDAVARVLLALPPSPDKL